MMQIRNYEATDKEKEVIDLLSSICTDTFPAMFTGTSNMLTAISEAFRRADKKHAGIPYEDNKEKVNT